MFAFLIFAQVATSADPLGPIITYLLGFGVLGILFLLALSGKIDLNPKALQKQNEELKEMNKLLVAALDKRGDEYESLLQGLRTIASVKKDL